MKKYLSLIVAPMLVMMSQAVFSAECPCWKNFKMLSGTCSGAGDSKSCITSESYGIEQTSLRCGEDPTTGGVSGKSPLTWNYHVSSFRNPNGSFGGSSCFIKVDNANLGSSNVLVEGKIYTEEEKEACEQLIIAASGDLGIVCTTP